MTQMPARYQAFWIPGLNSDLDRDDALGHGNAWLSEMSRSHASTVIVVEVLEVLRNAPMLARMASTHLAVSSRSRDTHSSAKPRAVLSVWPGEKALELAQRLALDGSLCVIPGTITDARPWVAFSGAKNLVDPNEAGESLAILSPEVSQALDSILFFDGHNNLTGAGGKENSIRRLRLMVQAGDRPSPEDVELYARASGKVTGEGARRLREWYEGLLSGKSFRGTDGRVI